MINCIGVLHNNQISPEKSLKEINIESLKRILWLTLRSHHLLQEFVGLLRKSQQSVYMILSAKVGSITDNKLGGWYGYRASKAALNMFIKIFLSNLKITKFHV